MQKELLSAYMDGEQISNELTKEICQDESIAQTWSNFHTIRTVMRKESDIFLGEDFTAKMAHLIEMEESHQVSQPTPEEVEKTPFMQRLQGIFVPVMQVAVAASVCLVAVIGVQSFTTDKTPTPSESPVFNTSPFTNNVQEVSYNAPAKDVVTLEQVEQKNKRIGLMLQNYELQRRVYSNDILSQPAAQQAHNAPVTE